MLLLRKFLILSERPSDCIVLISKSLFAKHLRFILSKNLSQSEGSFTHRLRSQFIIDVPKSVQRNFSGYWSFTAGISSSVNTRPVEIVQSENGEPELDWEYILDARNMEEIRQNVANRKGVGDIDLVHRYAKILEELKSNDKATVSSEYTSTRRALVAAASDLPNRSHPSVVSRLKMLFAQRRPHWFMQRPLPIGDETKATRVALCGKLREFSFEPKPAVNLAEDLGLLRTQKIGLSTGPRTYYLKNDLAHLEEALVNYTLNVLLAKEGCGFKTTGIRTQVYRLNRDRHGDVCLAGTGEISIAGFFKDQRLKLPDLPQRFCTVSRCFRAETSDVEKERGLYRVHQFTKVEMFGVTGNETGKESEELLKEILEIQRFLFDSLGLHFRILQMPSQELGSPAVQKFDMEAWLPARGFWAEISSASNCTDFQSRRLRIKYRNADGNLRHCHTVNGTACAVPRMLISILENYQNVDGSISIPRPLQMYMNTPKLVHAKHVNRLTPSKDYHFQRPL